jgi:hypothetical protein
VNLRYLVPVLGIIAVSIPVATAADSAPVITFDGWIDNKLTVSNANYPQDNPATPVNEKGTEVGFQNESSLKANIKISDMVSGKINLWLSPGNDSDIEVRDAYINVMVNPELTWQVGKYERPIGWISPEPTGLYTVNNSLIGYTGTYGNDLLGTNITWMKKDVPLWGSLHLVNGYFNPADAGSVTPKSAFGGPNSKTDTRGTSDLSVGLDLTWNLPGDGNFITVDLAEDPHGGSPLTYLLTVPGGTPAIVVEEGGNAFLAGVNGQYNIAKGFLVAAEILTLQVGNSWLEAGAPTTNGGSRTQGLILANYALPKGMASFPISFTGEIQMIEAKGKYPGADTEKATQETIAVLTNPTNSTWFGLNGELSFTQYTDGTSGNPSVPTTGEAGSNKVNAIILSIEAILSF